MPTPTVSAGLSPREERQLQRIALTVGERLRALTEEEKQELAYLNRRDRLPQTLEELVAWEREFGAENEAENERRNGHPASPGLRREFYKSYARLFDVPYATVKAAVETARVEGQAATASK